MEFSVQRLLISQFVKHLLKEIYTQNKSYFYIHHKNRRKHSQHFKMLFFTINLHFVTSNQIPASHQTKYPHIENQIYLSQAVFI